MVLTVNVTMDKHIIMCTPNEERWREVAGACLVLSVSRHDIDVFADARIIVLVLPHGLRSLSSISVQPPRAETR